MEDKLIAKWTRKEDEKAYWESHQYSDIGVGEYMDKFPNGMFIDKCDDQFWKCARLYSKGIEEYKKRFPYGKHISECEAYKTGSKPANNNNRGKKIDNILDMIMKPFVFLYKSAKWLMIVFMIFIAVSAVVIAITTEYEIVWATFIPLVGGIVYLWTMDD